MTEREREVVSLIGRGLMNREIADRLVVSERTVEWHISNIYNRLSVRSRAQLAVWSQENGLADEE